jgi:hypothetical protein
MNNNTKLGPYYLRQIMSVSKDIFLIGYKNYIKIGDYIVLKEGDIVKLSCQYIPSDKIFVVAYETRIRVDVGRIVHVCINDTVRYIPERNSNVYSSPSSSMLPDINYRRQSHASPYLANHLSPKKNVKVTKQCIHYIYDKNEERRQCRNVAMIGSDYCHVHINRH